jgi:hypothetical protein
MEEGEREGPFGRGGDSVWWEREKRKREKVGPKFIYSE